MSDDEKAQLFRTVDVYASPATGGESFGIVLLEAMAAGTPIVCSDIHGYKGVVRRGREGLLVPPHEPKELAAAIARLLADPELRAQMSAAGPGAGRGVQLGAGHGPGRGLLRLRHPPAGRQGSLPPDFRAPVPQAPPVRIRPSSASSTGEAALESASDSRQTQAE